MFLLNILIEKERGKIIEIEKKKNEIKKKLWCGKSKASEDVFGLAGGF